MYTPSPRDRSLDWVTLQSFWKAARRYPRKLALACLTPVSAIGMGVAIPYCIGRILSQLAHGHVQPGWLYALVASSVLTVVINAVAFEHYLTLQPQVMADLQATSLEALLNRGLGYHNNNVSGKLVSDTIDYVNAFSLLSTSFFVEILPFALVIILGVIVVAIHSLLLGLVLLLMAAVAVGSALSFRHRMAPNRRIRQDAGKAVTAHIGDTIVNAPTIKAFTNERQEMRTHAKLGGALLQARLHDWTEVSRDGARRIASLLLFEILFILVIVHQVQRDPGLLATGIFAFSYTVTLSNRLFQISTMLRQVEEALLMAEPTTAMLQEQPEVRDKPGAKDLRVKRGEIAFDDVSFRYADNHEGDEVFSNFTLTIPAGQKFGLVGPSGGGKSTFTKLLLRFEDVNGGAIRIDGQNIADITQASLRGSIAYVSQDPLLFHRTVRENIAYARPDASMEEITDAARKAYALDFVEKLPHGFDTVVGERGVKLSGGQRQRIAIARAILKNAPILVLDEATSALDSDSEKVIQEALWELMQDRTTVVIAHRLSTIRKMDMIVVIDDGHISEQGTHAELIKRKGLYAKLWNHQTGGFIEE